MTIPFDILTLPVGALNTNSYLVIDKKTSDALIIDPGDDADYIERIVQDKKCKVKQIIATHGHFDHILAGFELQTAYQAPFLINKKDLFLVERMARSAKFFLGITVNLPPIINGFLDENSKIMIGSFNFIVTCVPGHTPGSIFLYSEHAKSVFCGDLLFSGGSLGRTDFSYSDKLEMGKSIKKILQLPQETIIYPGHGHHSKVSLEKKFH